MNNQRERKISVYFLHLYIYTELAADHTRVVCLKTHLYTSWFNTDNSIQNSDKGVDEHRNIGI